MSDAPIATPVPSGWRAWVAGARPRTLPAAVVPVLVGTACAVGVADEVVAWRAVAAGVVALMLQVGTNYANDYSDGVRGTDAPGV
ncbi:MAG: 1,4-dihydroxy-2-naphthoate polyprenyltransferase, partial [Actinomycetota bacterium]